MNINGKTKIKREGKTFSRMFFIILPLGLIVVTVTIVVNEVSRMASSSSFFSFFFSFLFLMLLFTFSQVNAKCVFINARIAFVQFT